MHLGSVFSDVPDKQQAWNDLIRLITDQDNKVRFGVIQLFVLSFLTCQINNRHGMTWLRLAQ